MTHRSVKNAQGQIITHDAAGRAKDPETWAMLDAEAWAKKGQQPPSSTKRHLEGSQLGSKLEASLGLPAGSLTGALGGGGYDDPDDPDVWTVGPSKVFGSVPNRLGARRNLPQAGATKKLSQFADDFYGLKSKELREFQEKAFRAGLYGTDDPNEVPWGDYDETTLKIWLTMGQRSAGFLKAGKKITPQQALDMAIAGKPAGGAAGEAGQIIRVSDPDLLRETIGNAVMEATGRRPDDSWIMAHVAQYQSLERERQNQGLNIGEAGGRGEVTELPSAADWAYLQVKKQRPMDVKAYQIGSRADEFFSLLGPPEGLG